MNKVETGVMGFLGSCMQAEEKAFNVLQDSAAVSGTALGRAGLSALGLKGAMQTMAVNLTARQGLPCRYTEIAGEPYLIRCPEDVAKIDATARAFAEWKAKNKARVAAGFGLYPIHKFIKSPFETDAEFRARHGFYVVGA